MAELVFDCVGARAERFAVVPTITLQLRISETSGQPLHAIALRCQIRIEPQRRRYDGTEAERLFDLFGETQRWGETQKPLQFTTVSTMVPGFTGSIDIDVPVTCTYDLEIASTKYFNALDDGDVPLLLLFSGTVFSKTEQGFAVEQVPWSKEAPFRLPVPVWRAAMDEHFPNSAWLVVRRETLDALQRFKSTRALPTWDATVTELLVEVEERRP